VADNVLQSFVIQLKYLIDDASQKKFHDNVTASVKGLNAFRLSILAAAVGVEEFVRRTTANMSRLSGLSRETNTTAAAIERLRARFEGAHLSAQEADASLRQFMELMRQPGQQNRAVQIIQSQFTDFDDFMVKAATHYRQLVAQYGSENDANVVAYRNVLDGMFSGLADKVRALNNNWERQQRYANETAEIYRRFGYEGEDGLKRVADASDDAEEAFRRAGKSIEVGLLKLLTHADTQGHTLLGTITNIADKFADWLGSDATQKQFSEFLDRVNEALPLIEAALTHIDWVLEGLVGLWVLNFGTKVLNSLNIFRNTLFGVGGALRSVATGADLAAKSIRGLIIAYAAWEGAKVAKQAFTGELHEKQEHNLGPTPWYAPDIDPLYLLGKAWRGIFGGGGDQDNKPNFQHGGIVSAALHAGEMVLPANISAGLQSFFGWSSGGVTDTLRRQYDQFVEWFAGDSSYKPQVSLDDQTIDDLVAKLTGQTPGQTPTSETPTSQTPTATPTTEAPAAPGTKPPGSDISGGGPTSVPKFAAGTSQQQAMDYFIKQGWTKEQAAGIVANLAVETGGTFNARAVGDSGQAYGIGQWHPDRQANFRRVFGHDIKESTYAEQLAFVQWELTNTESNAGKRLKAAASSLQAGGVVSQFYERPRDVQGNIALRGRRAAGIAATYQPGQTVAGGTTVTPPGAGTPIPDSGAGGGTANTGQLLDDVLRMEGMSETKDRSTLINFFKKGGINLDPKLAAWCGAFVNAAMAVHGIRGPQNAGVATNWAGWGQGVNAQMAQAGDVIVQMRHHLEGQTGGHVGIFTGLRKLVEGHLKLQMIAGNTSNQVKKMWVDAADDIRIRHAVSVSPDRFKTAGLGVHDKPERKVAVNSDHKVNINVYGADSHVTTKQLEQTQSRVAANHLRNMRAVVA
jgi:hypothetical protein